MRKQKLSVLLLLSTAFMTSVIGLLVECSAAPSPEKCGSNQSRSISKGPEKLLSQLHKNAEKASNPPFFTHGNFDEEEFKYVGKIKDSEKKSYELVLLTITWGESCRATRRLLVFGVDGAYLGNYGSLQDEPIRVTGAKVQFPFDEGGGNTIEFSGARPPSEVRLDGEVVHFESEGMLTQRKPKVDQNKEEEFESIFEEAMTLCEELFLPNSMARPSNFDLNQHLKDIESRLVEKSARFSSTSGRAFLQSKIENQSDEIVSECANKLMTKDSK